MGQKEQKQHFFANFLYFLYYKYLKRHFFTFVVIALSTSAPIAPKNFPHNPHDICELLVPIRSCPPPKILLCIKVKKEPSYTHLWPRPKSIWLNCMKWSEIDVVRLPPLEVQARSLINMLSMSVAEFDDILDGWRIRGRKPWADIWS